MTCWSSSLTVVAPDSILGLLTSQQMCGELDVGPHRRGFAAEVNLGTLPSPGRHLHACNPAAITSHSLQPVGSVH